MPRNPQIQGQNSGSGPSQPLNKPLEKNQKIAVTVLAVFGVFIVVFWFAQLRKNIYSPFASNGSLQANQELTGDQALAQEQALKNKDTDSDGLSDWNELNLYKTSPYLEDSDGDAIKDGEEITNGTDPSCPQGRVCSTGGLIDSGNTDQASSTTASPTGALDNLQNQNGAINGLLNQNGAANLSPEEIQALKNIDAASLRQLLLQAGMDKATLDKISDADLMKSYGEVSQ